VPKQIYQLKDFSGGLNSLQDEADINDNQLSAVQNFMFNKQGSITPAFTISLNGRLATVTYRNSHIDHLEAGYGLGYLETDHIRDATTLAFEASGGTAATGTSSSERGFYMDATSGDGARTVGARGLGGASAGADYDLATAFPVGTDILITAETFLNKGLDRSGQGIYKVVATSGNKIILNRAVQHDLEFTSSTDFSAGWHGTIVASPSLTDKILFLAHPDEHKIDTMSFQTSGSKWAEDTITLNSSPVSTKSLVKYYAINEAIRCCDTADFNKSKIQWYGFIQRKHFDRATGTSATAGNAYLGYYAKDNTLSPPTNKVLLSAEDSSPDNYGTYPASAGTGFNINIISDTDDNGAIAGGVTYELASTFIYDENQESLPQAYTNTHAISAANDLKSLSLNVTAKGPYDPRISGGRIYIREQGTDAEYTMLVDIDLTKGCRTKFSDDYTAWFDNGSNEFNCPTDTASSNFVVKELGLITYEVINGYSSSVFSNAIGDESENWKDSIVSNNRAFVCNVSIKDENSGFEKEYAPIIKKPDRIMYSMPNRFDTFPSHNYIEAARGDADIYIAIDSFADRLLAFKKQTLDIINISSPDDATWFLEDSKRFMGIMNPELVKKTQYGLVFANYNGLFIYNGNQIINLSENLIGDQYWQEHMSDNSSIIYDELDSLVYVVANIGSNGDAYMCNLKKNVFTYIKDFTLDTNDGMTNSVHTDQDIYIVHDEGSNTDVYTFDKNYSFPRPYVKQTNGSFSTKMFDFGNPSVMKRIYAVYLTYKSDEALTGFFTGVTIDGSNALAGTIAATTSSGQDWATVKITPSAPFSCEKMKIVYTNPSADPVVFINDISIEYRTIKKRTT